MSLKPVGSIFDMSIAQIDFYSTRLYPHNHIKGYWEFSSVTGFLNPKEDLLQCAYNDCYLIESHGVTHNAIVRKLIKICRAVMFQHSEAIIDGKFEVKRTNSTKEYRQLCPFSPPTKLNPFEIPKTCGQSNMDFFIHNIETNRVLKLNSLLIHLICDHHFFEGQVLYRINPLIIIETLEIERKVHQPKRISNIKSNSSWKSNLQKVYPIETSNNPLRLSLKHDKKMHRLSDNVVGLILPYPEELDNDELVDFKNPQNLKFLHLFNLGNAEQTISGDVEGATFKNVTIPSNKRIVLIEIRCNDIH